jgi:hypothetical protein
MMDRTVQEIPTARTHAAEPQEQQQPLKLMQTYKHLQQQQQLLVQQHLQMQVPIINTLQAVQHKQLQCL